MMYLSQLSLRITHPAVRQSLRNCQDLHRTLMKAFDVSREQAGLLYRMIRTDQSIQIYVQSLVEPDWSRIESCGFICLKQRDISTIEDKFRKEAVFRFSVLTYPSKKVKGEGKNSRRVFLRTPEERLDWLHRQGIKNGFSVLEAYEPEKEQRVSGAKATGSFFLSGVTFEGVLRITDPVLFLKAFQKGIGSEKAYGLGLLMLRKLDG